jgi:hypothetical protein
MSYLYGLVETVAPPFPPSSTPYVWISDEVMLYPPAVFSQAAMRPSQWLFIETPKAQETWRATLEAIQSGLFRGVFLRPSVGCAPVQMRKLQLAAEKARNQVFILGKINVPHWMVTLSLEIERKGIPNESHCETDPLSSELFIRSQSCRGMLSAYA